jgi:hypothetical protein
VGPCGRRRTAAFDAALIKLGGPPPSHIPAQLADAIADYHGTGELTAEDVAEVLVEAYGPERLDEVLASWADPRHTWLGRGRLPIMAEGLTCYRDQRYYAAVCTLLPQIEGVAGDALQKEPNAKNDAPVLFADGYCSGAARRYFVKVLYSSAQWGSEQCLPGSRHAVLHGNVTDYGAAADALKVILALDAVIAAGARYHERPPEDAARGRKRRPRRAPAGADG